MPRPKPAATMPKKRAAPNAAPAPSAALTDELAALDVWADAFHGVTFDETLHRTIARFIVSATERHSLLDPFQVPFA